MGGARAYEARSYWHFFGCSCDNRVGGKRAIATQYRE
jgi:hypothetical protein